MILVLHNVSFSYHRGKRQIQVFNSLNFEVAQGERVALLGESGSGKSTALKLASGVERADSGSVMLDKHDLSLLSAEQCGILRLELVGQLFQDFTNCFQGSARKKMLPSCSERGVAKDDALGQAREALTQVGITSRAGYRPGELTIGQQQRVSIDRALMLDPKVVLADEPTGSLDPHHCGVANLNFLPSSVTAIQNNSSPDAAGSSRSNHRLAICSDASLVPPDHETNAASSTPPTTIFPWATHRPTNPTAISRIAVKSVVPDTRTSSVTSTG